MSTEQEVDRQVETREPLDVESIIAKTHAKLDEMAPLVEPTVEQTASVLRIIAKARGLVAEIIKAVPEGDESHIAINAVKSAILWSKQGILGATPPVIISATGAPGDQAR